MAEHIRLEKRDDATFITIERADCGGLVSDPMALDLTAMIDEAGATSRFIVLQSEGADFCLGRDPTGKEPGKPLDAMDFRRRSEVVFNFYDAFRRSPVPVICTVQGRALGFGCAIASVCDITIAAESARFALPEMAHNIMPTMAMSALTDRVGRKGVLYLTYSMEEIDAGTALAYGLISRVVPDDQVDAQLEFLCGSLRKAQMPAVLAVKEYASNALSMTPAQATDFAKNMHAAVNSARGMIGNK